MSTMPTQAHDALDTTALTGETVSPVMGGQGRDEQEVQDMAETLFVCMGVVMPALMLAALVLLAGLLACAEGGAA